MLFVGECQHGCFYPLPVFSKSATPPGKAPAARRRPVAQLPRPTPAQIRAFRLKSPRLRLITVWLVLIVGMLGLAGRLAYLQLFIGTELKRIAKEQQTILATPRTAQQQMVDRQGNVVAMDRVVYTLYVHPMLFKKSDKTIAEALSGVLERSSQDLLALFAEQESGIKLSGDIFPEETAERLQGLRLDGLEPFAAVPTANVPSRRAVLSDYRLHRFGGCASRGSGVQPAKAADVCRREDG